MQHSSSVFELPGVKILPEERPSSLRFFLFFVSPSKQVSGNLTLGHDCSMPHPFQLIISYFDTTWTELPTLSLH